MLLCSASLAETAIGRLNHAGYRNKQHCTAVLVAPRVALTASHCLQGLDPREAHLLLGYERGSWTEHLQPSEKRDLGSDLSVLCLAKPAQTEPLALSPTPPSRGETLIASGYGIPSVHLKREQLCRVTQAGAQATFRLDCPLAPGNSGGPVLRRTASGDKVVGIASASNNSGSVAVAIGSAMTGGLCPQ